MRLFVYFVASLALSLGSDAQAQVPAPGLAPPIYDIHFHVMPFMAPDELRKHMDRFNILKEGGGGTAGTPQTPAPVRDQQFRSALGERMIPSIGFIAMLTAQRDGGVEAFSDVNNPFAIRALNQIEAGVRDQGAKLIGEIHVNSSSYAPQQHRRKIPADGPFVRAIWDLAAKYDVPLMIHLELESSVVQQLDNLLATSDPKVQFILAHCGSFTTAAQIKPFIEKYPNFACDLSYRSPPQLKKLTLPQMTIFDTGGIKGDWQSLIEQYPERFAVGIDDVQDWGEYDGVAATIRQGLLARLKPDVARKVAYENVKGWLKLD
jgi:hypothetical protein